MLTAGTPCALPTKYRMVTGNNLLVCAKKGSKLKLKYSRYAPLVSGQETVPLWESTAIRIELSVNF